MINICIVEGHAGSNAEMRYTPSGTATTRVSIAYSERYQKDGEWVEVTHWIPISAIGAVAEKLGAVEKGDKIFVEGEFSARTYEDKDGTTKTFYAIKARRFQFLSKKSERPKTQEAAQADEDDAPWD